MKDPLRESCVTTFHGSEKHPLTAVQPPRSSHTGGNRPGKGRGCLQPWVGAPPPGPPSLVGPEGTSPSLHPQLELWREVPMHPISLLCNFYTDTEITCHAIHSFNCHVSSDKCVRLRDRQLAKARALPSPSVSAPLCSQAPGPVLPQPCSTPMVEAPLGGGVPREQHQAMAGALQGT